MKRMYLMLPLVLVACTSSGGYSRPAVVYAEPVEYVYVAPVDQVVLVSRDALVSNRYTTLAADAVRYIIDDAGARVFFMQDMAAFDRVCAAIDNCGSIIKIVLFSGESIDDERFLSLDQLEAWSRSWGHA